MRMSSRKKRRPYLFTMMMAGSLCQLVLVPTRPFTSLSGSMRAP